MTSGYLEPLDDPEKLTDEQVQAQIGTQIALVGPILKELLARGAIKDDYWLKGASTALLSDFIIGLQDMATLFQQQLQAAGQVIDAQEKELEKLRPKKRQVWTP